MVQLSIFKGNILFFRVKFHSKDFIKSIYIYIYIYIYILDCSESSCRKRFKFNKCILKFKSSAFQFSFKIGTNFPDNPIYIYIYICHTGCKKWKVIITLMYCNDTVCVYFMFVHSYFPFFLIICNDIKLCRVTKAWQTLDYTIIEIFG